MKTYGFDGDAPQLSGQRKVTSVYVYEAPLRLWHWITVLSIIVLSVTGYFIGKPLPSMQIAEATHQFVMGYIRFAHFAAAMILTVGFFGRIIYS